jgi:8-oxo-dGTP pyrophosphatase MutT (NUDIX family)
MEETGLELADDFRFATVVNVVAYNLHYVTLFFLAHRRSEELEAEVMEPHKCESWEWVDWDAFPQPWFSSTPPLLLPPHAHSDNLTRHHATARARARARASQLQAFDC